MNCWCVHRLYKSVRCICTTCKYYWPQYGNKLIIACKTVCKVIENNAWQNPYHMPYHPEKPISSRGAFRPVGWCWSRVIRHMIRIFPCFIHFIIYLNRRVYRVCIIYKYILLVRVICEKYRLRGEANRHLTILETGIFRK